MKKGKSDGMPKGPRGSITPGYGIVKKIKQIKPKCQIF